jgi:hypothetical protein
MFPETSHELRSSIRNYSLGYTMKTYNLLKINIRILIKMIIGLHRNEMSDFVRRSTITQIESKPFSIVGNPTMKSITISSHFKPGIESGCNNPGFM